MLWGPAEHLLANLYDVLAWGNYQRAHGKGQRPRRHPRPSDPKPTTYGKAIPIEHARAILERRNGRRRAG